MQGRLLSRLIHHLGFQQGLAARKRMLFAAVIIQAEWMPLKILGQNPLPCRQDLKHRDQLVDICMEGQVMVIWVYFLHSVSRKKAQLYVFKKLGHVFISVNLICTFAYSLCCKQMQYKRLVRKIRTLGYVLLQLLEMLFTKIFQCKRVTPKFLTK